MPDSITVRTNNVPRDLIDWNDLTEKEQAEFDYIEEPEYANQRFFRYRGNTYDINEFESVRGDRRALRGWHGFSADSYFSGILVKLVDDNERVIVGNYYC